MAVFFFAIGVICVIFRYLWRKRPNSIWWTLFICFVLVGLTVGIRLGVFFEYQPNRVTRVQGFPIPLATFVWEEDHWTDFVPQPFIQYGSIVVNILLIIAFIFALLLVAFKVFGEKRIPYKH